jgi:hypothetical protein
MIRPIDEENDVMFLGGAGGAPAEPPTPAMPSELDLLKQKSNDADNQRLAVNTAGAIGDILSSRNGFGNFYLGKMNGPGQVSKFTDKVASGIEDPMTAQQKAMAYVKSKREESRAQDEDKVIAAKKDPASAYSLAARAYAKKYGIPVDDRTTGYDIDQMMDQKKMREQEAKAKIDFENEKKIAAYKAGLEKGEGAKAVDKDYAKDYNDFTGGGATKAQDAIAKLKTLREEMKNDNGFIQAGGGPISGSLPDAFRTQASIARRDNIVSVANSALKATFGGQLSDGERKALANEFYNDRLSNEENLKIIDRKIAELENGFKTQQAKAKFFERNRTLRGFDGTGPTNLNMVAGGAEKTHPQADKAVEWARNNPSDPRASEILKRLGINPNTAVGQR